MNYLIKIKRVTQAVLIYGLSVEKAAVQYKLPKGYITAIVTHQQKQLF